MMHTVNCTISQQKRTRKFSTLVCWLNIPLLLFIAYIPLGCGSDSETIEPEPDSTPSAPPEPTIDPNYLSKEWKVGFDGRGYRWVNPKEHASNYLKSIEDVSSDGDFMKAKVEQILSLRTCMEHLAAEDVETALSCLENHLMHYPADSYAYFTKGQIFLQLLQSNLDSSNFEMEYLFRSAFTSFTTVLRYNPLNKEALMLIQQIESFLTEDQGTRVPLAFQLYRRGLQLYYAHLYEDAVNDLSRAIELDPNFNRAKASLSQVYLDNGQLEDAKTLLDELLQANSNNAQAFQMLSLYYERKKDMEQAFNQAFFGISADPNAYEAWYQLAHLFLEENQIMERLVIDVPLQEKEKQDENAPLELEPSQLLDDNQYEAWMYFGMVYKTAKSQPSSISMLNIPEGYEGAPDMFKIYFAGLSSVAEAWSNMKEKDADLSDSNLDTLVSLVKEDLLAPFIFLDELYFILYADAFYTQWKNYNTEEIKRYVHTMLVRPLAIYDATEE